MKPLVILSQEGTTQGCPLAMLMYAIGVLPLISRLKDPKQYKQNWYADDSACAGSLQNIKEWLLRLMEFGPSYGYYAEPTKSVIIVKEDQFQKATALFADLQVEVVLAGQFLGAVLETKRGSGDICNRRSIRELKALSSWLELLGPICCLHTPHLFILFRVSGRTFKGLSRDVTMNISSCATPSDRFSPQQCWEERCLKESTQFSSCLLSWEA